MATDSVGFSPSTTLVGLREVFERIGNVVCLTTSLTTKMVCLSLSFFQTNIMVYCFTLYTFNS